MTGSPEAKHGRGIPDNNLTSPRSTLPFRGVENDTSAYLPLDQNSEEIRYLRLEPGAGEDPLVCFMGYTNLGEDTIDRVDYEALSYCWGSVDDTLYITLCCPNIRDLLVTETTSHFSKQYFKVTRNLHAALCALRYPETHRILWIDAICINQADPKEKAHQVGSMSNVYSKAMQVVIWLGEADISSRIVFQSYQIIGPLLRERKDAEGSWNALAHQFIGHLLACGTLTKDVMDQMSSLASTKAKYTGICSNSLLEHDNIAMNLWRAFVYSVNHVLSRSWFTRVWVLQEVLRAPIVSNHADSRNHIGAERSTVLIAGQHKLCWHEFCQVVNHAYYFPSKCPKLEYLSYGEIDFKIFERFVGSWVLMASTWRRSMPTIFQMLEMTRHFQASERRDKLYALLPLASDVPAFFATTPLLKPDYSSPLEIIMANFIRWHIQETKSLQFLTTVDIRRRFEASAELPSWVPDIFQKKTYSDALARREASWLNTLHLDSPAYPDKSWRTISMTGFALCKVEEVATPELRYEDDKDCLYIVEDDGSRTEIFHYLLPRCQAHFQGVSTFGQCLRLIRLLNLFIHKPGWVSYAKLNLLDILPEATLRQFPPAYTVLPPSIFVQAFAKLRKRRIFFTSNGKLVLGHMDAQIGDDIVILHGCSVPFILHPHKQGDFESTYEFLGICFSDEKWKMEEAFQYQETNNIPTRLFGLE